MYSPPVLNASAGMESGLGAFPLVTMLFHAFLLELAGSKDHGGGPSTCVEATLALRKETLLQVI